MSLLITYLTTEIRRRWQQVRETNDAGYSTEAVLTTALLVALAITVLALIGAKVVAKAGAINLG